MWRRLLVRVSGMATSLVAMHMGHHSPCAVVTTDVSLTVKSQVGFLACHENQMAVAVVKRDLCLFQNVQPGSGAHPAFSSLAPFQGAERRAPETDHSRPSSAELNNEWRYVSTRLCLQDLHWKAWALVCPIQLSLSLKLRMWSYL